MRAALTPIAALTLLGLAALSSVAADALPLNALGPDAIAGLIDVTSFPNSIGPRRQKGLRSFADYGFTQVEVTGATVELYEDERSWMFAVTMLESGEDSAIVCILDRALGGATYHARHALGFALSEDGWLVATGEVIEDSRCPTRP